MERAIATPGDTLALDALTTLRTLFDSAVQSVSAEAAMPRVLPDAPHGRLVVVAVGKAAADMMRVARERARRPVEGLIVTR